MPETTATLDLREVIQDLMRLRFQKHPTITSSDEVAILDGLLERTISAVGARLRQVQVNTTLENIARQADHPEQTDATEIKVLGVIDHTLKPTRKLRVVQSGDCPGVTGIIVETDEPFCLLPDKDGMAMVIFPKESS